MLTIDDMANAVIKAQPRVTELDPEIKGIKDGTPNDNTSDDLSDTNDAIGSSNCDGRLRDSVGNIEKTVEYGAL